MLLMIIYRIFEENKILGSILIALWMAGAALSIMLLVLGAGAFTGLPLALTVVGSISSFFGLATNNLFGILFILMAVGAILPDIVSYLIFPFGAVAGICMVAAGAVDLVWKGLKSVGGGIVSLFTNFSDYELLQDKSNGIGFSDPIGSASDETRSKLLRVNSASFIGMNSKDEQKEDRGEGREWEKKALAPQ